MSHGFFYASILLSLVRFLSHFIFWFFFLGCLRFALHFHYSLLWVVTLAVCPPFYTWSHPPCIPWPSSFFDKSQGPHFVAIWHCEPKATSHKGSHFYVYSTFIKTRFNKDAKVCTYFPIFLDPFLWCKFKSSCPFFRIWLCEVNLSFNLTLNAFQGKVTINSTRHLFAPSTIARHDLPRKIVPLSTNQHSCWLFGTQSRLPLGGPIASLSSP